MSSQLNKIFAQLGLNRNNGLFITEEGIWKNETDFPNRIRRLIERKIEPTAFFCFDNKPLILFFHNPSHRNELYKAIWNFNECPIAIFIENDSIEIYNGFNYLKEQQSLQKLGGAERLTDFKYFELVTGKTWDQYSDHLSYKNRVDYHLLNNIKGARNLLIGEEDQESKAKIVNSIIGKCIFVRYLIDRKVKMKFDDKLRTWSNSEFCELLNHPKNAQKFFDYLEDNERGFNGDLFPISSNDYKQITKGDYQILRRLLQGEDIGLGQLSLFELYDFSIIPIEFISNVYELFIGQDNQKKEGAYYTPLFLVDYILKETVEKHLCKIEINDLKKALRFSVGEHYSYCKVLDPACGSGIFLVETLRKIIEKYINETNIDVKSKTFKTVIKNLAQENIYGVDKDLSAVQVAVFSIYLTLLDYLEPPGIETFKFPQLFNTNFFQADFFDEKASFNGLLKNIKFDFILGNPPWKGNGMEIVGNKYLKNRKNREQKCEKKFHIAINNNEIAEGFILRVSDFCNSDRTKVGFIVRSSSLYNLGYNDEFSPFRQYWLEEYFIDKVLELAPVRYEVFEKSNQPAVAPAAVLFYRYANGLLTDNNVIEHIALKQSRFFSLFKIFTINRTDYKHIQQKKLKEFDWLWKVLVYGSYLDFNFIKRIKEDYTSIKEIISDSDKFIEGTGIQYSSNPSYSSKHLVNKPFIDSYGVTSFFIIPEKITTFNKLKVHRLRDERLFKAPMLLIREGIDMDTLTAKCAISEKDLIFKDSITSIKIVNSNDIKFIKNISAIFSTSLFSYYAVNTFASIGIERERVKNYNKYSLPYLDIDSQINIDTIEQLYKKIHVEKNKVVQDEFQIHILNNLIEMELNTINKSIFKKLAINDIESALIDYAIEINARLIIGDNNQKSNLFAALNFEERSLKSYADLYIERFKLKLETNDKKFVVEIWHTKQIIGMFFKMVPTKDYLKSIVWVDKQNNNSDIIEAIAKISSEKITDSLFVQKDIRGFEKDFFYIFKPNEKRLWHKAVGYLDVNEFASAILNNGGPLK